MVIFSVISFLRSLLDEQIKYLELSFQSVDLIDADGDNDLLSINNAILEAKSVKDKPSLIKIRTTIGYGSSKQSTSKVHGSPLGDDEIKSLKIKFGLDPDKTLSLSQSIQNFYSRCLNMLNYERSTWNGIKKHMKHQ